MCARGQALLLVGQVVCIAHAVAFVASSASYESKLLFGRTALFAAATLFAEMLYRHRPSAQTPLNVYKALR